MLGLNDILSRIMRDSGSDLYILPGAPVAVKIHGRLEYLSNEKSSAKDCEQLLAEIYQMAGSRSMDHFHQVGEDDFSFSMQAVGRFRCSAYKQRGSYGAVLRAVPFTIPEPTSIGIPKVVMDLYSLRRGMVLVTGPAGSGKSTTLACIVDRINRSRSGHIITIEDPIEYLHGHDGCMISQREVGTDTQSFASALRAALRQAPDVILLGEMRDYETVSTALTAAETGHLLLSTLHTVGAAKTIDRIVDVFPANQQQQVRVQLSMVLRAVVSQQLIPTVDGGIAAAFEVMVVDPAIASIIREGKVHQLDNMIFAGSATGMMTMDNDILRLYNEKRITRENALMYSQNPEMLAKRLH